ncbi:GNAT family N-acetyltransferase [Tateyamaria sp. SN6-1]|uniref:GNAT family N-acetyltransferase n=1 Tax=Tateyamaria sp. SN6-1 TaxID=3092148 RepID=UPI0039F623C2
MTVLTLRAAQPTDAGATGAILSAFAEGTRWMPRLHTRAETISFTGSMIERGWVEVAEQDGQVLGFIARDGADVHALYVAPDRCGCGIGAALLHRAQDAVDRLNLWTFEANTGAQRFYARHGFSEVRRTDGDNEEGLPDILLRWQKEGQL